MNQTTTLDGVEAVTIAAIIPCYNYGDYVEDAIESAMTQSPPFDEIIVVDDGSTDDSLRIIRRYAGCVRIIERPNGGQLSACREALAACQSEYVYFLDADDFIVDGFVRTVVPLLEDRPVKLQFQLHGVDADGCPKNSIFPTYPANYSSERMREDNLNLGFYICPPTTGNIYQRKALAALPLDQLNQREFIDGPPALVMPYVGAVKSINVPLGFYRVHGKNVSQWNRPTVELLSRETTMFLDRWSEASLLVRTDLLPEHLGSSVYIRERVLMTAGLGAAFVHPATVLAFVRGLLKTHIPTKFKIVLSFWALLFLIPSRRFTAYIVSARRAPESRPAVFNYLLTTLRKTRSSRHGKNDVSTKTRPARVEDA